MNKKGAIMTYITMIAFFLALIFFYLYFKPQTIDTSDIGEIQIATLKTMQEAEKDLLYIDNAAKLAAQQALFELAEKGGFEENSNCGEYGFNLWNNKTNECYPDYKSNFTFLFNKKLNRFLVKKTYITNNYDFLVKNNKLQIIGLAIKDLVLKIRVVAEKIKVVIEYIIPTNAEEVIKKIKDVYEDKISIEAEKYPEVDESLVIAVIAQESAGNPYAVSPTGCLGVNQFCLDTAKDFSSIFGYVKRCSKKCTCGIKCTREQAISECGCDINDGRLDPEKSIEAGTIYLSQLLGEFEKEDFKEEFAIASYNAGKAMIGRAVTKAGGNPSWEEVASEINEDLIYEFYCKEKCSQYFDTSEKREEKVNEVLTYVSRVMGYKEQFEENSNLITGNVIKTPESGSLGKYSIKPNFKVNLDYNLDEYNQVIEDAKQLVEKCKDDNNLKLCINQNKKFDENCETEEEKIKNKFTELFEDCYKSNDFDCYCEANFDYENNYEFDELNLYDFKIKKYKLGKGFELEIDDDKLKGDTLVIFKEKIIGPLIKDLFYIGKKIGNKLELIDRNDINTDIKDLCRAKQKRKFRFCYNSDKQVLTKQGMKEPIIRFALMFPDIKAPEALNVNVMNYPNDKYRVILTWNKDEDDVVYRIYYSDEDFKDKEINELGIDFELTSWDEIGEIDLEACEFKDEQGNFNDGEACRFDKYNKKLENNILYFIENENKYVYVLELTGKYNFLVTAVDDSDNEIDEISNINYKTTESRNMLPFMKVKNLEVKQDGSGVKLTWDKPDKYKDGTSFSDEELKRYNIKLVEKTNWDVQDISVDAEEWTFISMNKDDYFFSVAAVNNDEIIGDYASYP